MKDELLAAYEKIEVLTKENQELKALISKMREVLESSIGLLIDKKV